MEPGKDPMHIFIELGDGSNAVGACYNKDTTEVSLLIHPLDEPQEVGTKVPHEHPHENRDILQIRVLNEGAASVLLRAVQVIHDIVSGKKSYEECKAAYDALPEEGISITKEE